MDLMVEASPRRIFANAHTYHINSISVNSDHETYLSADDLRINLWHLEITDRSFSILYKVLPLLVSMIIVQLLLMGQLYPSPSDTDLWMLDVLEEWQHKVFVIECPKNTNLCLKGLMRNLQCPRISFYLASGS